MCNNEQNTRAEVSFEDVSGKDRYQEKIFHSYLKILGQFVSVTESQNFNNNRREKSDRKPKLYPGKPNCAKGMLGRRLPFDSRGGDLRNSKLTRTVLNNCRESG